MRFDSPQVDKQVRLMPEGDSIHRLANRFNTQCEGSKICKVTARQVHRSDRLLGAGVLTTEALGKHLLIHLDNDHIIHTHLGREGRWIFKRTQELRRASNGLRLRLVFKNITADCLDPRTIEVLTHDELRRHQLLGGLGPDILSQSTDWAQIYERIKRKQPMSVADMLLDQSICSGIGNVYKSEVLFLEQRHPLTAPSALQATEIKALYQRARRLMRRNLGANPRRTRWADGPKLWVYNRNKAPCLVCGTLIGRFRQGQPPRSTYLCRTCQSH
ncbi:MAG: DNA-formamidopyrimidine glycosylase family protein [Myxococcota bacterium]|nr:DNA-formamidopyrimidine glycosylase family protein [Myxococcota bacterium]